MIENWMHENSVIHEGEYNLNKAVVEQCFKSQNFFELAKNYTHITPLEILEIFRKIRRCSELIIGKGLDLGGGPGIVASTLAQSFNCQVDFVELVNEAVTLGYPIVQKHFGHDVSKRNSYHRQF